MTEWHIFTKNGEEYTGAKLKYEREFMVLYRHYKIKIEEEVRDWKWLWFGYKTIISYEREESYDYLIPIVDVLRVERHDITKEEKHD